MKASFFFRPRAYQVTACYVINNDIHSSCTTILEPQNVWYVHFASCYHHVHSNQNTLLVASFPDSLPPTEKVRGAWSILSRECTLGFDGTSYARQLLILYLVAVLLCHCAVLGVVTYIVRVSYRGGERLLDCRSKENSPDYPRQRENRHNSLD